ncbi:glycoside hydrolase 5 family protein [Paraglaciecola hydrolytica]|uniref:Glycoside hydrolase family 5 domain-containing protein n=1 Tax=Paraglaciecola hydrolytica TaxID=1799789 RepID=A0A136A343_9ALTE|nr:hypothetical protein [Paraglaciecola hydrolytica]KXI29669.1 hypothetical protein AX660_06390 [Paraglaciecola hydrolytica]
MKIKQGFYGLVLLCCFAGNTVLATQLQKQLPADAHVVDGVLRYSNGSQQGQEVALFGVNYAVPFAYSYRALKKRGIDHKTAIDMDVDHIARLGLDAYRVHIWDRQISDQQGNLLVNEHLQLFDYLLAKLAEHGIRVIITPIAWWGSGYPEPDPDEPGFASFYSKGDMNHNARAITAQHNYLKQFFTHINSYTGLSYGQDPNVIAIELFNEPRHEDSLKNNEVYIEGLVKVVRDLGITKPLFYNISEQGNNPKFAARLCSTSIDGVAYQWYPTGLVKNSQLTSNMLSSVAHYTNPFSEIAACQTKARMIYEFDAADTAKSVMYPAMARSFKEAGFQWATQFAYDPAAIADTNSDYNTHYLNLLYTPAKAISFMIAAEVFRQVPLLQQQADYPASNNFTAGSSQVSVDYQQDLSVLNSPEQFLYSNSTQNKPLNSKQLKKIAGVGSSPVVSYQGSGAYFLDKISEGNWRLEVYPDVLQLQDPYQSASLKREVGRLYARSHTLKLALADLGKNYVIQGLNQGNNLIIQADKGSVTVNPGVYLLSRHKPQKSLLNAIDRVFLVPQLAKPALTISHQNQREISVNDNFKFKLQVGSEQQPDKVELAIRYRGHKNFSLLTMHETGANHYAVSLPHNKPEWSAAGQLEYVFVITEKSQNTTFPGGIQGSPDEWDFVASQAYWQTELRPAGAPVTVFDALLDSHNLIYPNSAKSKWEYVIGQQGQGAALRLSQMDLSVAQNPLLRMTLAADNQLLQGDLSQYNTLAIKLRAVQQTEHLQFSLLDADGLARGMELDVTTEWQYLLLPLSAFKATDTLFPQSYPMFMPASYPANNKAENTSWLKQLNQLQGLQFVFAGQKYDKPSGWHAIDIAEVKLLKR